MDQATNTPSAGIALGFDRDEGRNNILADQPLLPRDDRDGERPSFDPPNHNNDQSDEPMDILAMLVQQFCSENNIELNFDPNAQIINPNTGECHVSPNTVLNLADQHDDDVSVWDGMSVATKSARQLHSSNAQRPSSSSGGRSIASHEINEPRLPAQSEDPVPVPINSPDISVLRELVDDFLLAGNVELAIECLIRSITDNAHSKDVNLACFCLTKLWDLARESDVNKRAIISGQYKVDGQRGVAGAKVIIETMMLSACCTIERIGCGLLWSLSMMVENRPLISKSGGIEAILNAQLRYKNDLQLQLMGMGALKVLSFDPRTKDVMRRKYGTDVVALIMNEHTFDATIQSDGCVIIGNCAVDEGGNFAERRVYEREIEAILAAMLAHDGSLVVVEAALFTLMSLACWNANATVIRQNQLINIALEKAFERYPNELAMTILTFIERLKEHGR